MTQPTKPEPIFPSPMSRIDQPIGAGVTPQDETRFTIRLRHRGRHWHAHITQGIAHLGESGSTTYRSRHRHRTVRKAMRTISRQIANQHHDHATIHIEER